MSQQKQVFIIGVGMDGAKTLTQEAKSAIEKADLLIGAKRMTAMFAHLNKPMHHAYISQDIADRIQQSTVPKIAVLMSGDCGFYSGAEKLVKLLPQEMTTVISGISSPIYFCAKLKKPWQDVHFVSLHGQHANIIRQVCTHRRTFFLLGGSMDAGAVCRRLCDYGLSDVSVAIGENLAGPQERILQGKAEDFIALETGTLSVLLAENPNYEQGICTSLLDELFIRGKVPMTKSEIRTLCTAKLNIAHDSICWDIGCGTGSVSVAMAFYCPDGMVHAVDKNAEAIELTRQNQHQFRCDNITTYQGDTSAASKELPTPDCVFIGGSGGTLSDIIQTAYEKNPKVRLVITAVSLETLQQAMDTFSKLNLSADISQIAVTRTRKIGSHTMLQAENPIYIIQRRNP